MAHQDKACMREKIKGRNDCSTFLFGGSEHGEEGDRNSPLKSNGQALKQEYCLPGVLSDHCDPPANFLNQLNSHLVPCPGRFNGDWEEKVNAGEITVLGDLVCSRLVCCGSWSARIVV